MKPFKENYQDYKIRRVSLVLLMRKIYQDFRNHPKKPNKISGKHLLVSQL